MKGLIDFFLKRTLLVNLISIMIILFGLISVYFLRKEMFPRVDFGFISVSTNYLGASAEDVEKLVTISLERELREVEGIEEMNSVSVESRSIITIKVDPDFNTKDVYDEVKSAVDQVDDLPDNTETPLIKRYSNKDPVLRIALWGLKESDLRDFSKKLRSKIELIDGISKVNLEGYRDEEINVSIDPDKLNYYGITIGEVAMAVKGRNVNLAAGKIETKNSDIIIRTVFEYENAQDVADVVVRSNDTGQRVKVSDLGVVKRQLVAGSILNRAQGKNAIFLEILKKESTDILKITDQIKTSVDAYMNENSRPGLDYRYVDELAFYVNRRLSVLVTNGIQGMILVFLCLLFFLNTKTSVVTSLGAPLAFMTAFMLMDSMGLTMNLVSMFGLILVLGMLVDDSIIVAEQFYQHLENGKEPYLAAQMAAHETVKPVLATVLTTMVAFGALFFMGGIMGKYLWPVPAVVIICLMASLLECFFILPNHLAGFVSTKPVGSIRQAGRNFRAKFFRPLIDSYSFILRICLRYYVIIPFIFFGILFGTYQVYTGMAVELFPGDDARILFLSIKGKVGTPLETTNQAMKKVDDIVLANVDLKKELETIRTMAGMQILDHNNSRKGNHYGTSIIYLTQPIDRKRSTDEIMASLDTKVQKALGGEFEVTFQKLSGGPPKGRAVEIELGGPDLKELQLVAHKVKDELEKVEGIIGPEIDYEEGKKQFVIRINDEEARRLGLSTTQVALEIRNAYAADAVTVIRDFDEDINVVVQFNNQTRSSVNSLNKIYILNAFGRRILLSKVAKIEEHPGAFAIRRFNRQRTISVVSEINREILKPTDIPEKMNATMVSLMKNYPNVNYKFGGENKDTKESMMRLIKAGLLALGCILLILITMFSSIGQPLVIMSAIPLGLVGVVWIFKIMGLPFSFMGLMGVVGLVGVVVNDSIVLVSFINTKIEEGLPIKQAVYEGSRSRFRAVILTTYTTVAGLLPIAHASAGDPFLRPMALSFAYGLLFSSTVTLIFVPCSYQVYWYIQDIFMRPFRKNKVSAKEALEGPSYSDEPVVQS